MMKERTITRRLAKVLNGLEDDFSSLFDRKDFENKLDALKKASKSERPSRLKNLYDLFTLCGIKYEFGKDNKYYENLIKKSNIPTFSEMEDKMLYSLYTRYQEYPSPQEYMQRIVDNLSFPEDHWERDTLRVRILKQFVKYGNCLTYHTEKIVNGVPKKRKVVLYGGNLYIKKYVSNKIGRKISKITEATVYIDDGIFNVLNTAKDDEKRPRGPYGILKMVDDLASGKFHGEGATKKGLYLFAMVYQMTYHSGYPDGEKQFYQKTDIEKNLFVDYYTNNLMRFLSDAYRGKLCKYELDPSGQGINYKNFAEMIYLYYISKDCPPQDKIKLSDEMITRVKEKTYKTEGNMLEKDWKNTLFYRKFIQNDNSSAMFSEDILSLPDLEFEEFICENYQCDTYAGTYEITKGKRQGTYIEVSSGELQLKTEQDTAFGEYEAILTKFIQELKRRNGQDLSDEAPFSNLSEAEKQEEKKQWLSDYHYGLWFTDMAAFQKEKYTQKKENLYRRLYRISQKKNSLSFDRHKVDQFIDLLFAVDSFIRKGISVSSSKEITRTSMIVAYYYYFNMLHETDGQDSWRSFGELYKAFENGINQYLENSYYQPLNGKSIFDILVVFSSYAYVHDLMF